MKLHLHMALLNVGKKNSWGQYCVLILSLVFFVNSAVYAQTFRDVSEDLGVRHYSFHDNRMCAGIGLFDYDNDGFIDIYTTGGEVQDHFYKNVGGSYVDYTDSIGVDIPDEVVTCGVAVGDFDKDGFDDLLVTTEQGWHNYLFKNNGNGTFSDVTAESGVFLEDTVWSNSAVFVDINVDGHLDMYVTHYVEYTDVPHDRNVINNRTDVPILYNYMYINQGDGTFVEKAQELGIANNRATLAATAMDINGDYLPDLFDANDFGRAFGSNSVFLNDIPNADSMYSAAKELNLNDFVNGMGITAGDVNNDLKLDVHFTDWDTDFLKIGAEESCDPFMRIRDQIRGVCWGTAFVDYNNDSHLDIFTAYGHVQGPIELKLRAGFLRNNGDGSLEDVSEQLGFSEYTFGRGAAIADYDNDGDMDLFLANVNHLEGPLDYLQIFENNSFNDNSWLNIYLKGNESNPDGYDATLYCHAEGKVLMQYMDGGSSYLSRSDAVAHFGLGQIKSIDSLVIVWPGGKRQVEEGLSVNTTYTIEESASGGSNSRIALDYSCFVEKEEIVLSADEEVVRREHEAIYPNPVQNILNIKTQLAAKVNIYDLKGNLVLTKSISRGSPQVVTSDLSPGPYLLKVESAEGVSRSKFLKK